MNNKSKLSRMNCHICMKYDERGCQKCVKGDKIVYYCDECAKENKINKIF
jgi:hypothetical protein